jgi:hypothetical protein
VARILYIPFSIASGLLAGAIGRRLFAHVWSLVDEEEPPEPTHRRAGWGKLLLAAALQGAVFRLVRAAAERGSREAFLRLTGTWPGEEKPEREP